MSLFKLHKPYLPSGDQPKAIDELLKGRCGKSTLLGVTGSGKTYTIANVIAKQNKPVLILSPNKTLAAQLYEEFSLFFPKNKICYFVSYYDYYQPESYLPAQDIYIPKETKINSEIERLRIEATASLINRKDTIVIASVSSIYSLGNPEDYRNLAFPLKLGQKISRGDILKKLIDIQYTRNDIEKNSGTFQVIGNIIELVLPYQKERLRIELFNKKIESIQWISKQNNRILKQLEDILIFPAKHFVTTEEKKQVALKSIETELHQVLKTMDNDLCKERLRQRVTHDIELIKQLGYCSGIENYSSHFDGRFKGEAPHNLFDFFGDDFLLVIDESHIAIPQLQGMYHGDKSRKGALIDYGFRLPSAYDNRPLRFDEIEKYFKDTIFISATPGQYELNNSDQIVEQIIRPTGLLDPKIEIRKREGQLENLLQEIEETKEKGFRTLVTVLTKKMAEDLAYYLEEKQVKVCYLHSDIKTPQRTEILQKLRLGIFDVLVGVNLLREGLDLPEVALVAIMDADIESFLRDKRSLIQTIGRGARNTESKVLLYADKITQSMKSAIDETDRRRKIQEEHNIKNQIEPKTVKRDVVKTISPLQPLAKKGYEVRRKRQRVFNSSDEILDELLKVEKKMQESAKNFEFDQAIELRNEWKSLKSLYNRHLNP